jgi:hypothetical protein
MATKNNFQIVISANDRATSSIRRINDSMSKMVRPVTNVHRTMQALTKEVGRNVAVKALSGVGRAAENAASGISKIISPMSAVIGAGSIAGIAALATNWGRLGVEVSTTASLLGSTTSGLQSLRGAAELAGVSSETLTSGLGSLRQTMQDAKWGRNQPVVALMDRLGIGFRTTADGGIDVIRTVKDISNAIVAQKDIGAKHTIAQGFGGLESLLPLLMKGQQGIEEFERRAKSLGLVMSNQAVESAKRYGESILQLEGAMTGLKNSVTGALVPAFTPLIAKFTNWVELNREAIAQKVADGMEKLVKWVSQADFSKIVSGLEKTGRVVVYIIDKLDILITKFEKLKDQNLAKYVFGGMPRILYDLYSSDAKPGGPAVPSSGSSSAGPGRGSYPGAGYPLAQSTGGDTRGLGYNHPVLNAYAAQVEQANSLPPGILNAIKNFGERSGSNAVSPKGARGVMQFMPDTWKKFGVGDPSDPYASIDAGGRYMKDMLRRYGGNVDAAITEYNGGTKQAEAVRGGGKPWVAETANYLSRVKGGMAGGGSEPQKMDITLNIPNAPAGTTATAKTKSGDVPIRINHSMNTLSAG